MRGSVGWLSFLVVLCAVAAAQPQQMGNATTSRPGQQTPGVCRDTPEDIPSTSFQLSNGLTVVLHEDHKTPLVAMNLQYRVGSRDEAEGKTGLAHLFEHLMFYGSEHAPDGWFPQMARLGLSEQIGQTHNDVTRYAVTVPTGSLDAALWLESDRMGYLSGALDQKKLDAQRGVIENEVRQGTNQPYAIGLDLIAAGTYPPEHPYHRLVLGTFEDRKATTLEDVQTWLRGHYTPNNAVLVLAGDIDPGTIREKVERYFGAIPAGPPVSRYGRWPAPLTSSRRQQYYDRVPSSRIQRAWNIPGLGTAEYDYMKLFGQALGASDSRLVQRLVKEEKLASEAIVWINPRELGSSFVVSVTMAPNQEGAEALARAEKIIDEEVTRLLASGPSPVALQQVAAKLRFGFLREIEKVGYYGGSADQLGWGVIFAGTPQYYREQQSRYRCATVSQVRSVARTWLTAGSFTLTISPIPRLTTHASDVDRSSVPASRPTPNPPFPTAQRFRLQNGLSVVVLERSGGPVVQVNLVIRGGSAADPDGKEGIGNIITNLLVKQATDRGAAFGPELTGNVGLEASVIGMSVVRDSIAGALALLGSTIRTPPFTPAAVDQARKTALAAIAGELATPRLVAGRVAPLIVYPPGHPYARPLTGTGYRETVAAITASDVATFYSSRFRPNNATLVIAGAVSADSLRPSIERAFASWAAGPTPTVQYPVIQPRTGPATVYLVNAPGATQADITAGFLAKPMTDTTEIVTELLARILAAATTSRLTMNLREAKHWAYITNVMRNPGAGPRPFLIRAAVQPDKAAESIKEIAAELNAIQDSRPVSEAELRAAQNSIADGLASRFESSAGVASAGLQAVIYGFRPDYFATYGDRVRAIRPAEVTAAAQQILGQGATWLVIGDLSKIEGSIRALNLGDVKVIPADARSLPK
jgi:zinc protease